MKLFNLNITGLVGELKKLGTSFRHKSSTTYGSDISTVIRRFCDEKGYEHLSVSETHVEVFDESKFEDLVEWMKELTFENIKAYIGENYEILH